MKNLSKFLEFNNKKIAILLNNGTWWIAIKPLCEALEIKYEKQRERISEHPILAELLATQSVLASDNKLRDMLCLPEAFIYGWLFSIQSDNPVLIQYQRKCYDILFQHFHGALTGRITALSERDEISEKIAALEEKLLESKEYQEIQQLKKQQKGVNKTLVSLDNDLRQKQLRLELN